MGQEIAVGDTDSRNFRPEVSVMQSELGEEGEKGLSLSKVKGKPQQDNI